MTIMTSFVETDSSKISEGQFLEQLQDIQDNLYGKGIDYRIIGSVAAHALLPPGSLEPLDFDRRGAILEFQRHPDIDLVVPRAAIDEVRIIREKKVREKYPVKLGLAAAVSEIDFRPDEVVSLLTHKGLSVAVENNLLAANNGDLGGVPVRTLSIPILTQTYQTFGGIVRRKDMAHIRALVGTEHGNTDISAFREFRQSRRRMSPSEAIFARGLEGFNEVAPPVIKNIVAAAAIKAADVIGKR